MAKNWVICYRCKNIYLKDNRHINENIKLGHKFFCSAVCFFSSKNKQIELTCQNVSCKKLLKRAPGKISPHNFCSRSCAAIYRNIQKWGLSKPSILLTSEERNAVKVAASSLGGTNRWLHYKSKYTKDYIVTAIKGFESKEGRVPFKKDLNIMYKQARLLFGTWNKAIKAAGFDPNPVMFANKQIAKDGHVCDSIAEKIIDDFLLERGISHERNYPYPEGRYTADFKIGNRLIEYFSLSGEHRRYDELKELKRELARKHGLNLIEIYPKSLFPISQLNKVLVAG